MVKSIPDEDFGIESSATALNEEDCRFCYHRDTPTRTKAKERFPNKKDVIEELPSYADSLKDSNERDAYGLKLEPIEDKAAERIEIFECYAYFDYDGDGVASWYQVYAAGSSGGRKILSVEDWGDELPFTDLVPDPVPHRWRGRSIYDLLRDVQRVKTVLLRKMLDNLYMTVEPNRAIDLTRVKNPDVLADLKAGDHIYTDGDPNSIIRDMAVPFVAKEAAPMLDYMDKVAGRRTGMSDESMGMDGDVLQNQTAEAVQTARSALDTRKEDYARNIGETGFKRFFRALLKLIVKHQDKPRMIRLRGEWIEMDPRSWNANMDVSVNVGLGSGSRDRDLQMLQAIAMKQEQVVLTMGPTNPVLGIDKLFHTYRKMAEVSGIKGAELFFPEINPETLQQMQQAQGQQQPDPAMMKAQAQIEAANMKAQADAALKQQQMTVDFQMEQQREAMKLQTTREMNSLKMALQREMQNAQIAHMEREAALEFRLRQQEMRLEAALTQQANVMNAQVSMRQADTNINRPE